MKLAHLILASLPLSSLVSAQQLEVEKWTPPPGEEDSRYAWRMTLQGEWAMVGALAGESVYVYRRTSSGWRFVQRLRGDDQSYFGGASLDIDVGGTSAVIGAPEWGWPDNKGRAQVFELSGDRWIWSAGLSVPGLEKWDGFGASVSISGDTLAVTAPGIDDPNPVSGRVYIFEREGTGWQKTAELMPDVPNVRNLGRVVVLRGDTLVTHGVLWDQLLPVVFVFERDSAGRWIRTAMLAEPEPKGGSLDMFPGDVALSEDGLCLVVGDVGGSDFSGVPGEAYVWERDDLGGWNYVARLRASDGKGEDSFGGTIEVEGDRILLGDSQAKGTGFNDGAGYLFLRDASGAWPPTESLRLLASDLRSTGTLGDSIGMSEGHVLMGSQDQGAYLFELSLGESFCPASANSTGKTGSLSVIGDRKISEDDLALSIRACPPGSTCVPLLSSSRILPAPMRNGFVCLGLPMNRLSSPVLANPDGVAYIGLSAWNDQLVHLLVPGSTWMIQAWYTDSIGAGSNLTNAVAVTLE